MMTPTEREAFEAANKRPEWVPYSHPAQEIDWEDIERQVNLDVHPNEAPDGHPGIDWLSR